MHIECIKVVLFPYYISISPEEVLAWPSPLPWLSHNACFQSHVI